MESKHSLPLSATHVCVLRISVTNDVNVCFSATSDGTRQGLDSMRGGVCATQGMKVVLKVGQSKSSHFSSAIIVTLQLVHISITGLIVVATKV